MYYHYFVYTQYSCVVYIANLRKDNKVLVHVVQHPPYATHPNPFGFLFFQNLRMLTENKYLSRSSIITVLRTYTKRKLPSNISWLVT